MTKWVLNTSNDGHYTSYPGDFMLVLGHPPSEGAEGSVWRREAGQPKLQQKHFCSCMVNQVKSLTKLTKKVFSDRLYFLLGFTGKS